MLILHSDTDGSVPVQQAMDMAEALKTTKARHRLSLYKNKGHMRVTEDVIKETRAFIEEISKRSVPRERSTLSRGLASPSYLGSVAELTLFDANKMNR